MKRNFKLLVAVIVLAAMVFTFASCDKIQGIVDKINPHEHSYSADWSHDAINHWHAATCDKGDDCAAATADLAAHTLVDGVCSVCGYTAAGSDECEHSFSTEVTTNPTCTEPGEETYTCTKCGHSYTQAVASKGHTAETISGVAPTCTTAGMSSGSKCSVCGVTLKEQSSIDPVSHEFKDGLCIYGCGTKEESKPALQGSGTDSDPFVIPETGDYVAAFPGGYDLVFFQYAVPSTGYVTISSDWTGSAWLKAGADIYNLAGNDGSGDLTVLIPAGAIAYFGVADWDEQANDIPFTISFEATTSDSIENLVDTWSGEIIPFWSAIKYTVTINEDGLGTIVEDGGYYQAVYDISFIFFKDNKLTIIAADEYGNAPGATEFIYDEENDSLVCDGGTLTRGGETIDPVDPDISYDTVIVIGANTLYFSVDEITADTADRKLTISVAGNYKLASGNLFVSKIVDADGVEITKNADYSYTLLEGDYTVTFGMLSTFGVQADTATSLNVETVTDDNEGGEGGEGGEGDDEPTYIEPYDTLKDSLYGFYTFEGYEVFLFYKGEIGEYLANIYGDGFELFFTYDVTTNDDATYTLSLTYYPYEDMESGTNLVDTILGYDIVIKLDGDDEGDDGEDDGTCDHEWSGIPETYVDATCIANGSVHQVCDLCGAERDFIIEAAEWYHNYQVDAENSKAPTCTEGGYDKMVCTICGDSYNESLEPAHEYNYDSNPIACSICDSFYFSFEAIDADNGYKVLFYNGVSPILNVYDENWTVDDYYSYTVDSAADGVYTLTLIANDVDFDTLGMNNATAVITITDDSTSVVVTCVDGKVYNFATASSSEEGGDDEPASTVLEFGENTITIGLGQMYLGVEVTFTATEDGVYVITAGDNTYVSYEIGFDYFAFSNGESKEIKLAADESITFVVMRDDWTSGDAFVTVSAKEEACAHSNTTTSTTPASCSTDGSSVVTCEDCGEVVSSDVIPATGNHTYVEGVCSVCEAEDPDYVAPTVGTLATFDFGANGTAAHVDNQNALTGNTTVTSGDYSLVITSPSKVYDACFDEKGNSCLKLGSSSAIGSFSFTVSENVTEVVIYVAKYKDKTTKVSINGGAAQTINTSSNNGEYTAITIDTTTTKTISFATVSGGARCMINTIVFNGYAK